MKRAPQIILPFPARYTGGDVRIERDMQQLEICTLFKAVAKTHADTPVYEVLTKILGGGRSTPLFQKIRADLGLVYDASPVYDSYVDAGVFGVSAGLSPRNMPKYLDTLTKVLQTGASNVTEQTLQEAKNAIKGEATFSLEGAAERAEWAAQCVLHEGKVPSIDEHLTRTNGVTRADLKRVLAEMLSSKPTLAVIGKIRHLENYDSFAARFAL